MSLAGCGAGGLAGRGGLRAVVHPRPSGAERRACGRLGLARQWRALDTSGHSGWRAGIGFAIGGGIGLLLGFITGLSTWGERLLDSSVQMIRNVPHLALIPLVILWFGIDEGAKIFLVDY